MARGRTRAVSAEGRDHVLISVALDTLTAPLPVMVSERTSLALYGIDPSKFVEVVSADYFGIDVIRVGDLHLVERVAFEARLRALAKSSRNLTEFTEASKREQPAAPGRGRR